MGPIVKQVQEAMDEEAASVKKTAAQNASQRRLRRGMQATSQAMNKKKLKVSVNISFPGAVCTLSTGGNILQAQVVRRERNMISPQS